MEANILETLQMKLKAAGPDAWEKIADKADCNVNTIRRIAYADLKNPGLKIVQAIADHLGLTINPSKRVRA